MNNNTKGSTSLIEELKDMSFEEMDLLAVKIREALIDNVSKTGGHFASNMGIVELTLAIHNVFDVPKDKLVWDVGHQTYVHKMLTGRWDRMGTLRQLDGLSGFPKRAESPCDMFDSGHSGTSISAALGFAKARDLRGEDYSCVAVIGDGALTGGVAYEAMNSAGIEKTPLIVILNDNAMSISKNVGGMARHLQELRISSSYLDFKRGIKRALQGHPRLRGGLETLRNTIKYAVVPGAIFEELGFKYFGPIDGHDIRELTEVLTVAKGLNRPVLIHVVTKKGKGFINAEKNPAMFHGIGPFDPENCLSVTSSKGDSYSDIFGQKLLSLASSDESIVAVTAAMTEATGLMPMKERFSERVFDAGIAEQHAVSFAAGLALNGMRPVVAIYSTFLQRAYDQVLTEVCLQRLPVVFAVDRAGVTGKDGETHQGNFDIAYLSSMPNMTVLAPKDGRELEEMLEYALTLDGPCAIRYPRGRANDLSAYGRTDFSPKPELIEVWDPSSASPAQEQKTHEFAMVAVGSMNSIALEAADILNEHGIRPTVYNLRIIKPLPKEFIQGLAKAHKAVLVLEDASIEGGAGMAIAAYIAQAGLKLPILTMGWPDKFIEHGGTDELYKRYGLDGQSVASRAEEFFEKKA